ncbi:MAG: hypothetical protein O7F12_08040 [Nitrospirae bacterium]|nr:hypothetical protein [Nitrospirota bacterium]
MKNVQVVFNIQVPDHVSEHEVSSRLNQVIGSLMAEEFGLESTGKESHLGLDDMGFGDPQGPKGHA